MALPSAFLVAGALIGYAFSLDTPIASERLIGLVLAIGLGIAATFGLARPRRFAPLLVGASMVALAAALWVIAASGPDVFRGTLGMLLDKVLGGVFYRVNLTNPVAETNTWFIVGYNGVIDLSLLVIFACGALAFERRRTSGAIPLGIL